MRLEATPIHTLFKSSIAALAALATIVPMPASAQGDLLIAPTRLVLDGRRGGEVILNNMGNEEATYRITLELRRMDEDGNLVPVSESEETATEKAALEMIRYAPRRVTLPPDQPQSVRISARPGADLPDGEYRVHMSFAALPKVKSVADQQEGSGEGISIRLTPIYGIVMPIIIRKGELKVTAGLANPRIEHTPQGDAFAVDMERSGTSSIYGDLLVYPQGASEPVFVARGLGVYPEISERHTAFAITPEQSAALKGPVRIEFRDSVESGGGLIASVDAVLG
ncbi:molecular chaperone [Croceibacterium aestuarii]|uniref:molecular chaperone n=1 Tax=Croceibacterium aestuarii TaxID=3064139 RepID=UPI00272DEA44|nr:molecular chaperone [Croceibacterium sp. D39]